MSPHLETLIQRRNWLRERIKAKRLVSWDVQWDEREEEALTWAIGKLSGNPMLGILPP